MRSDFIVSCAVLEELDLGMCREAATIRVHDVEDAGTASILSCQDHVPLARYWVRRQTKSRVVGQSRWPKRTEGAKA